MHPELKRLNFLRLFCSRASSFLRFLFFSLIVDGLSTVSFGGQLGFTGSVGSSISFTTVTLSSFSTMISYFGSFLGTSKIVKFKLLDWHWHCYSLHCYNQSIRYIRHLQFARLKPRKTEFNWRLPISYTLSQKIFSIQVLKKWISPKKGFCKINNDRINVADWGGRGKHLSNVFSKPLYYKSLITYDILTCMCRYLLYRLSWSFQLLPGS